MGFLLSKFISVSLGNIAFLGDVLERAKNEENVEKFSNLVPEAGPQSGDRTECKIVTGWSL